MFFTGKPDILAAGITLLMMILLAAGVKKSLMFNHLMNAINLAAWVFLMSAGLFYVNLDNWTENDGFLPNGWGGVSATGRDTVNDDCVVRRRSVSDDVSGVRRRRYHYLGPRALWPQGNIEDIS